MLASEDGSGGTPVDRSSVVVAASQTYDRTSFSYQMELRSKTAAYSIYRLTYPSPTITEVPQNNTVPADFYLPSGIRDGDRGRPAVICLHILDGDFELMHIACSVLATRGIPAVAFKLPYYGERALPGGRRELAANPMLFVGALSQTFGDIRRTIDLLSSRTEIDPQRIGIMGISMGAITAASAAGAESRLSRVALILSGGDLMKIIHHARETQSLRQMIDHLPPAQRAEVERTIAAVDPLHHAAGLRQRALDGRVLMINAAEDEVIPRQCTQDLAAALGIADKVLWLQGLGHYTTMAALPQALRTTADFFAQDLPPGVEPPAPIAAGKTPVTTLVALLRQTGVLMVSEPLPGKCHFVDFDLAAKLKDGQKVEGHMRYIRGAGNRFFLQVKAPVVGEAMLGQGEHPWMASGGNMVFKGTVPAGAQPGSPLAFADEKNLGRVKMFSGLLATVAMAPEMLQRWVTVTDDATPEQPRALKIAVHDDHQSSARLVLRDDGFTPETLSFNVQGVQGTVTFRAWQLGAVAHESLFEAPANLPVKAVDMSDLYRMFSAMFNFALENVR